LPKDFKTQFGQGWLAPFKLTKPWSGPTRDVVLTTRAGAQPKPLAQRHGRIEAYANFVAKKMDDTRPENDLSGVRGHD
jgi:hypothetical protein